jgi:hypothetical protein
MYGHVLRFLMAIGCPVRRHTHTLGTICPRGVDRPAVFWVPYLNTFPKFGILDFVVIM